MICCGRRLHSLYIFPPPLSFLSLPLFLYLRQRGVCGSAIILAHTERSARRQKNCHSSHVSCHSFRSALFLARVATHFSRLHGALSSRRKSTSSRSSPPGAVSRRRRRPPPLGPPRPLPPLPGPRRRRPKPQQTRRRRRRWRMYGGGSCPRTFHTSGEYRGNDNDHAADIGKAQTGGASPGCPSSAIRACFEFAR